MFFIVIIVITSICKELCFLLTHFCPVLHCYTPFLYTWRYLGSQEWKIGVEWVKSVKTFIIMIILKNAKDERIKII